LNIVAFLQNQWFQNPDKAREVYAKNPDQREELNKRFLFAGCMTGRRLQTAFGPDLCDQIIWEEVSPQIGGKSNSTFPADQKHISSVIEKHQPDIILTFGSLAKDALNQWSRDEMYKCEPRPLPVVISGPHPAARYGTVQQELWEMRDELLFKQKDVFGVDVLGRYDYSRKHESTEPASV